VGKTCRRTGTTHQVSLITAELSRRNYQGRVYAKGRNVRPTHIQASDAALANVAILVMPTACRTAPKNHRQEDYLDAVDEGLETARWLVARNTLPFNFTGHTALATLVGKSSLADVRSA
jgi:Asp-tRNA(Asn)/Glu-tRNA(Gln) amidotransferase A subunit family amidase